MDTFCSHCGTDFDEGDRFCAKCGTARDGAPGVSGSPGPSPAVPSSAPSVGAPPVTKPKKSVARVILLAISLAVLPLFFVFGLGECGSSEGQMTVTESPHGEWTFVTTGCASMQPYGQMGANLHGDGPNDGAVYVTLDHVDGHRVELEVPGSCQNADGTDCTVFRVPRDQCQTFDVALDYTNVTVNDVRLVEGHVSLQCSLEDGSQIQGSIVFDGC